MGALESAFLETVVVALSPCGSPPTCYPCTRPQIPDYLSDISSISEETKLKKKSSSKTESPKLRSGCFHVAKTTLCLSTLAEVTESEDDSEDDSYRLSRPGDFEGHKALSDDSMFRLAPIDEMSQQQNVAPKLVDISQPAQAENHDKDVTLTLCDISQPTDTTHRPERVGSDSDAKLTHSGSLLEVKGRPSSRTPPHTPPHTDSDRSLDRTNETHRKHKRHKHKHRTPSERPSRTDSERSKDSGKKRSDQSLEHEPTRSDSDGKSGHKHWFSHHQRKSKEE